MSDEAKVWAWLAWWSLVLLVALWRQRQARKARRRMHDARCIVFPPVPMARAESDLGMIQPSRPWPRK